RLIIKVTLLYRGHELAPAVVQVEDLAIGFAGLGDVFGLSGSPGFGLVLLGLAQSRGREQQNRGESGGSYGRDLIQVIHGTSYCAGTSMANTKRCPSALTLFH